ncbi:GNAT family N-acetyltransferase [Raoultibacter phocaeensis]|uniref:GNAT family N-acetyltransferase n=1 Tax=Raoultibacter phocaeensis TaxID=2479841 RepID=UPI00111A3CB0|nr:GNAT family N-acetyltransferase [Raoultibacter phocaeensis]
MEIKPVAKPERTERLVEELARLWEASVRPTYAFLSETDVVDLRPEVRAGLAAIDCLAVAFDDEAHVIGFVGVEGDKVEMLFVAPEAFGAGVGRKLLERATRELGARKLDVNEGNPGARGFYEHLGFEVVGRSEVDDQGRPFPLLHMELR